MADQHKTNITGRMEVLGVAWDRTLGGRDFNARYGRGTDFCYFLGLNFFSFAFLSFFCYSDIENAVSVVFFEHCQKKKKQKNKKKKKKKKKKN